MTTYYRGNYYLSMAEMEANAQYIYNHLIVKGWSSSAICGMLGNMQSVSTINPGVWEALDDTDPTNGYGLMQWKPSSDYINWAMSKRLNPDYMKSNLAMLEYECENNLHWSEDAVFDFQYYKTIDVTPDSAAIFFMLYYHDTTGDQTARGEQALYWDMFLDHSIPTPVEKKKGFKPWLINRRRYTIWRN